MPPARSGLFKGLDDVGVALEHLPEIESFEASYRVATPWLAAKM